MSAGDLLFFHDTDLWDWLIQKSTGGLYNHVEIITTDDNTQSIGAKADGVQYHTVDPHFYTFPVTKQPVGSFSILLSTHIVSEDHDRALAWVVEQVGKGYDWLDILMNLWALIRPHGPFPKNSATPQLWICSELAATYLILAGSPYTLPSDPTLLEILTPNDLFRDITTY